jgi:hypothetical protein
MEVVLQSVLLSLEHDVCLLALEVENQDFSLNVF